MLKHIHFTFIFEVSFPFIRVEVLVHSVFTHLEATVPEDCGKTRHGCCPEVLPGFPLAHVQIVSD